MYQSIEMFENLPQGDCDKTESEKLTSLQEDSPARTLVVQVSELVSMIQTGKLPEAGCGQSTPVSLAKLSPAGSWLKMFGDSYQSLLWGERGEDSELFSGTWLTWGIVLDGVVMELPMLERRTEGTGCSSWPTPRANKPEGFSRDDFRPTLAMAATWQDKPQHGQLNADWVEILMGYPIGYTDIDCDEPTEWPGWPAGLGAREWPTPQAQNSKGIKGEYCELSDGGKPHDTRTGKQVQSSLDQLTKMPMFTASGQYPCEPPRVITGQKNRAKRLKTLGNSVVPAQAYPIFKAIMEVEDALQNKTASPQQTD